MSDKRPNGMRSNAENILRATLGEAVEYNKPNSPVEYYLVKLKEAIEAGGGGGGGSSTAYATAISLTIDSSTYVVTAQLLNKDGDPIGTAQTIDLPLETMVIGGSYNAQTKKVILTLKNGNTVEFSVADLVTGLQTEFSASNKLNPEFINYDSNHRAVSDAERIAWNNKLDPVSGKQLSTEDYTTAEKQKLAGLSNYDDTEVQADIATAQSDITAIQEEQTTQNAVLVELVDGGAKNRLPITSVDSFKRLNTYGTWENNVYTHSSGVVFTVNDDMSITANGTASGANAAFILSMPGGFSIEAGNWVLSGCPSGGSASTYNITIAGTTSDTGTTGSFTSCSKVLVRIYVINGTSISNAVFRPMVCSKAAWDISQAYQPYRPSYDELIARIEVLENA